MKTVYYLEHTTQNRRLKPYATLAGARIAQSNRHRHLGFKNFVGRYRDHTDRELAEYKSSSGKTVTGTWCIVEDTVDSNSHSLYED